MPHRPPASIDMLHNVMRPSIDRTAIALPANSTACPRAPSAPMRAMTASAMSLAPMPAVALPLTTTRIRLGFFCHSVCVIRT
jgi:hypothetical protein